MTLPIELRTTPRTTTSCFPTVIPAYRLGTSIRLAGTTDPAMAGDHVTLLAFPPGRRAPVRIGRARVAADGTFS